MTTTTTLIRHITLTMSAAIVPFAITALTPSPADAATKPTTIEVTASTAAFQVNAPSFKPGWTKVTLRNNDKDSHQAALIRLPAKTSAAAFLAQLGAEGEKAFAATTSSGGPAVAFPGGASSVTVKLSPGTYMAIDLVPGADGKAKATKGFVTSFVVGPFSGGSTKGMVANATVELHDFFFAGKVSLKAGTTLAVRNDGNQPHELVMFGLAPGKTGKDVIAFLTSPSPAGPPPFVAAAGMAGIAPKTTGYLPVDVPPGKYVFLCFLPDVAGKGEPHFTKGMVAEGEVTA
jgi:plastocyanin